MKNYQALASRFYLKSQIINQSFDIDKLQWMIDKSEENTTPHEAGLLKLNCDKALHSLNWKANLDFKETAKWTADWYCSYYKKSPQEALGTTINQIKEYMDLGQQRNSFKLG